MMSEAFSIQRLQFCLLGSRDDLGFTQLHTSVHALNQSHNCRLAAGPSTLHISSRKYGLHAPRAKVFFFTLLRTWTWTRTRVGVQFRLGHRYPLLQFVNSNRNWRWASPDFWRSTGWWASRGAAEDAMPADRVENAQYLALFILFGQL